MSESNSDPNHPVLNLSPQEKTAYSHLFSLADSDSLGVVTGERAVSFFEKTHVPAPVLGEIWQIADTENRGLLTKPGFCMVLRMIGWYQAGQQPTSELAFKPAPLPKFEGTTLSGGGAPAAPSPTTGAFPQAALQPQLSGQSTGGGPIRVPPLDPAKVQQYSSLFEKSGAQNGLLDGVTAKSIFERAGLPNEVLGKIWMLSDREQRGALDPTEFIVAMHLLTSMKTRTMTALPNTLPQGLYDAAARRGQRPVSRQATGPPGAPGGIPRQFTGSSTTAAPRTQSPLARPPGYSTPPPQSAQTTGTPWLITQQEKAQYDRFFSTIDTSNSGVLSGEQAVRFFSDSRLPDDTLASIWDLADINSAGQLNKDEFAVAMYLIRQQRAPNPPSLPAFLPAALIPPSMRGQQQSQQSTAPAFDSANNTSGLPKSASEDLFGLDQPSPPQARQPSLQPQGTGASATRDPFGGSQTSSPSSPQQRFQAQPQATGSSVFKPFMPTSAFGASLAQQNTGASTTSSQGRAGPFPQAQQQQQQQSRGMPSAMDDLLGDNDTHAEESSKLTNETTELANMSNQIGNLRTQMEATQTKKTATQADLSATSTQKRDLEQRLQQFRAQYESEVKLVKEMEQQLTASRESTKKLGQDLAMLEGTYQDLQTQHNSVGQQLQADQQENASLKQKISQINAEVARLKPEIEKMKLDARQQKGLVSINKKQFTTNEGERDRLVSEKGDMERDAAEQARNAAASPESAIMSPTSNVASPAASTMSSTNPFFRKTSVEGSSSPPPASSSGPTPSAFDALFGPSAAFAPTGQATSRSATPPTTSFIGRSMPNAGTAAAAGVGGAALGAAGALAAGGMADSMSSAGQDTPAATPPPSDHAKEAPLDAPGSAEPPPPPESHQFTPTNLPILGGLVGSDENESDAASSTRVIPPASRAGGVETPLRSASPFAAQASGEGTVPSGLSHEHEPEETEREIIPGAFPSDALQPTISAQQVIPSTGPSTEVGTPAPMSRPTDDFDSAFAGFGESEKAKETNEADDPFAPSSSQQPASQVKGSHGEFPPIQNLENDDDDDSDSDDEPERSGFDDNFTTTSPQRNGVPAASSEPTLAESSGAPTHLSVASGDHIAAARPGITSIESTASDLPGITQEMSPPNYEQIGDATQSGTSGRKSSNQFPSEYGDLLPSREDPTSPPPRTSSLPAASAFDPAPMQNTDDETAPAPAPLAADRQPSPQNLMTPEPSSAAPAVTTPITDVFVDASSRPLSSVTESANSPQSAGPQATASSTTASTAPAAQAPKSAFDEFDDFNDLAEAKEADKHGPDYDFGFPGQTADDFNPAFDSPAASMTNMTSSSQQQTPTPATRSVQQDSNGFANFTPNVSNSSTSPFDSGNGGGSIQHTPQNVQHDWDAIFSGLDTNKNFEPSLGNTEDPWSSPPATNGNTAAKEHNTLSASSPPSASTAKGLPELGRAVTPGTEHDDPILKRLTGMGYARSEALNALEMYDYDINKAVDHLTSA